MYFGLKWLKFVRGKFGAAILHDGLASGASPKSAGNPLKRMTDEKSESYSAKRE